MVNSKRINNFKSIKTLNDKSGKMQKILKY